MTKDVAVVVGEIRARGKRACFAVSPDLPLETLYPMLASPDRRADFLNLLMVKPGFAGQTLIPPMKEKLMRLKEELRSRGEDIPVMVDGNVSFENIPWMVEYGADVLILGTSSLFRKGIPLEEGLESIRVLVRRHRKIT